MRTVAWALFQMSWPPQLLLIAVVYLLGAAIASAHGATPDPAVVAV